MSYRIAFFVDSVEFTPDVIAGTASLGGSESACVGLARALARRGHDVTIYATKLSPECVGHDHAHVMWDRAEMLPVVNRYLEWDVFVSLRMFQPFAWNINARYRVLWAQDLILRDMKQSAMSVAWALDSLVYVSEYHRWQWEQMLPELSPIGRVTRNGYDPTLVGQDVTKKPNQIIHISRPERGLDGILAMWPKLRARKPDAELALCRYSSMYDATGWGQICASYDNAVRVMNEQVGGIRFLGELGKAELYKQIAESAVMWYPGVATFAETSCIAAVEAQANGTPFVGSLKGALPETVPSGVLVAGDAVNDPDYHEQSITAVLEAMSGCARNSVAYRQSQARGVAHVRSYTYDAIAADWDEWLTAAFTDRVAQNRKGVLERLLWEDDHTAAEIVATELNDEAALALCARVIAGKDHTSDNYAAHALEPDAELEQDVRFRSVAPQFKGRAHLLDVACGNGAAAIRFALEHPALHVHGIDFAPKNIEVASRAAARHGVADRVTFQCLPVWDFENGRISDAFAAFAAEHAHTFDAAFCGEFIEHVAGCTDLVNAVESCLVDDARVVYTCPSGNCRELLSWKVPLHRGHVHRFAADDLLAVFGAKTDLHVEHLPGGVTGRGRSLGNWIVGYNVSKTGVTGTRDYTHRILTTRPMATLTVGLIARDAEWDLGKCLSAVWGIADEIIVGDTGSGDRTAQVAREFGARVLTLPSVHDHPDGFAGVRNEVLNAATGDWFLWIDTDELLLGGHNLHKYLDGAVFNGYVLHQNHLMLDAPLSFDTPVRVFRRAAPIRFYGCVHEQPQQGDCNGEVLPTLDIGEVQLAHTGYLTEGVRRTKMVSRNLPLLQKDTQRFPDRVLGKVLVMRDYVNLAQFEFENNGQQLSPKIRGYLTQAIGIYEKYLQDPSHKLNGVARPYYDMALRLVAGAVEVEVSLAGRAGGLQEGRAKPTRFWARKPEDVEAEVQHRLKAFTAQMQPEILLVDPPPHLRAMGAKEAPVHVGS